MLNILGAEGYLSVVWQFDWLRLIQTESIRFFRASPLECWKVVTFKEVLKKTKTHDRERDTSKTIECIQT